MRRRNFLVFDEYIPAGGVTFTDATLNQGLGAFDQFAVMCVIENLSGTNGFDLWMAHSADGRLWLYRQNENTSRTGAHMINGDISLTGMQLGMAGDAPYFALCYDAGTTPLLAQVRLEMQFGAGTAANVKVYITQRDQGG